MSTGTAVHWFRKGLRLHDNPCLLHCIEKYDGKHLEVRPVFILDPNIAKDLKVGPNRWRFLLQSLKDLDTSLQNIGTRLFIIRGTPERVFPNLIKNWNVKLITFESDIEPYSMSRDEKIRQIAKTNNVKIIEEATHTIFDTKKIIDKNNGKAPLTYQRFLSVFESLGSPSKPKESLKKLNGSCALSDGVFIESKHNIPTLEDLQVDEATLGECKYPGGESEALKRMEKYCERKAWVCKFEKPNTSPNSIEPSTTVLSPYLKFGCLSPRLFYYKLKEATEGKPHSKPPVSLIGQLLWREFYYVVGADTPNFDKMVGNPICCQVPWDQNEKYLQAWTHAATGYPFIDAIMTQLRQEGWIHHLARHAVACFLTRGDLWVSWEEGQKVFEELLLDQDWALNAGNWMWLSASAFFHQYFRVYSPVVFGKKTDKNGDYIRKYVPVLKNLPAEYIYEPWKAPIALQKRLKCVVGEDYPSRIVIHEEIHKINIKRMGEAYKKNKLANTPEKRSSEQSKTSKKKK